jgi:hypothetical protein
MATQRRPGGGGRRTPPTRAGARIPANQRGEGAYQPRIPRPPSQAAKALANKALGKIGAGKGSVTIAQVQNDPKITGKTQERIIKALQDRNKRATEG